MNLCALSMIAIKEKTTDMMWWVALDESLKHSKH